MAVINFDDYKVIEMHFNENDQFNDMREDGLIELETEFNFNFSLNDAQDKAVVEIRVILGEYNSDNQPFFLTVIMQGFFTYNTSEDEQSNGFDTYLKGNSLAIMFPYIRQIVSTLTSMSNKFPTYTMPTINIAKLLEKSSE
ncbi:protein-export chaperone SecB [Ruoffia tabacinasalis]|uniref:protein-export chaperone SecB n=1 Tax=Ruoffia tabacinasalis TaxID=87458 RepID=UPI003F96F8C6